MIHLLMRDVPLEGRGTFFQFWSEVLSETIVRCF